MKSFSSDHGHKIMNYKLEDFDMVKTIGTGTVRIMLWMKMNWGIIAKKQDYLSGKD